MQEAQEPSKFILYLQSPIPVHRQWMQQNLPLAHTEIQTDLTF